MKLERPTIALAVIIGGMILTLGVVTHFGGENNPLEQWQPAAQILSSIVLIMTVIVLSRQLGRIREQNNQFRAQNELQRAVASKSAIQTLNEVILDTKQKDFLRFVVPEPEEEKARQIMMAFSLMNSLEMLYLTQREHKHVSYDDLKSLLHGFTKNVRNIWEADKNFATVYHPDFQKIVKEVFDEMEKEESSGAEGCRTERTKSDELGGET